MKGLVDVASRIAFEIGQVPRCAAWTALEERI